MYGKQGQLAILPQDHSVALPTTLLPAPPDPPDPLVINYYVQPSIDRLTRSPRPEYVSGIVFASTNGTLYIQETNDDTSWVEPECNLAAIQVWTGVATPIPHTKIEMRHIRFKYVNEGEAQTAFELVQEFSTGGTIDVNVVTPVVEEEILCPDSPRVATFSVNGTNQTPPYTREPIILSGRESVQFRNNSGGNIVVTNAAGQDGYTLETTKTLTAKVNPKLSKLIPPQDWFNAYSFGTSNEEIYDFIIEPDGYVVAGWTGNDPNNTSFRSVLLAKIAFDGTLIWSSFLRDPANDSRTNTCDQTHYCNDYWGVTVRKHPDGGYLIAGWTDAYSLVWYNWDTDRLGRDDALLIKTHADGSLHWVKHYDAGFNYEDRFQGMVILHSDADGTPSGIAMNGWSYIDFPYGGNTYITRVMRITVTDLDGNYVRGKSMDYPDGSWGYGIIEVIDDDGSHKIVATGSMSSYGTWCGIIKLNPADLSVVWQTLYDSDSASALYTVVQDIAECADGGFFVTGWNQPRSEYRRWVTALKTDKVGHLQWQKQYESGYAGHANSGRQTADGGFVIVGDIITDAVDNVERSLIIRTDSRGNEMWRDTIPEGIAPYGAFSPRPVLGYSVREGADGTIIVSGKDERIRHGTDIFVLRYRNDPSAWTFKHLGTGIVTDAIQRIEWK